jgi:hypothetical protein
MTVVRFIAVDDPGNPRWTIGELADDLGAPIPSARVHVLAPHRGGPRIPVATPYKRRLVERVDLTPIADRLAAALAELAIAAADNDWPVDVDRLRDLLAEYRITRGIPQR